MEASTSFAVMTAPTELKTPATLFEFPRKADSLLADKQVVQEVVENKEHFFPVIFVKAKEITGCVLNSFYFDFTNLFKRTGQIFSDTHNFLVSGLMNLRNSFFQEIQKINGSAFTTSASNLKIFFNQTVPMIEKVYNSLSSYIIFLRTSLLEQIDNLTNDN